MDDSRTLHNSAGGETASSPSRHTSDDEFDLDEIFASNPSTPKGRYAKWLRASGPMTIRRSKEEHPPSPSASSSSSSSPRHWQGSSELDELHGRAKTRRPLPERIVGDGCALPEFDYATLGEVDEPMEEVLMMMEGEGAESDGGPRAGHGACRIQIRLLQCQQTKIRRMLAIKAKAMQAEAKAKPRQCNANACQSQIKANANQGN